MAEETTKKNEEDKAAEGSAENAPVEVVEKKPSKKTIIIMVVIAILVLGAGGGAAFYFMHGKTDASKTEEQDVAAGATASGAQKEKPVYFSLGDLLVNLSGEGKHPNFLKVKISLELADEKDLPLMDAIKPRIVDNFQVYLRELRIEDLRGSAGMYRLREELLMRVTEAAQPVRVRDVLFQEMLVQ